MKRSDFCCNAEPGTYGHECGKPATWIATSDGREFGFCQMHKEFGNDAKGVDLWRRREGPLATTQTIAGKTRHYNGAHWGPWRCHQQLRR